jgi:hypothetical protein
MTYNCNNCMNKGFINCYYDIYWEYKRFYDSIFELLNHNYECPYYKEKGV